MCRKTEDQAMNLQCLENFRSRVVYHISTRVDLKVQDKQCTYKCNTEVRLWKHFCC